MQKCYKDGQRGGSLLPGYSGKTTKKMNFELGPLVTLPENKIEEEHLRQREN